MYQSHSPEPTSPRALQKPLPTMYDLPSEYPEEGADFWLGRHKAYQSISYCMVALIKLAEQEKQRADKLAEHLRTMGIDPDQL